MSGSEFVFVCCFCEPMGLFCRSVLVLSGLELSCGGAPFDKGLLPLCCNVGHASLFVVCGT